MCGSGLSGVVAVAAGLPAAKVWELSWRGWGFGKVFEREWNWQMLRNQWFLNLHIMHFFFPIDIRERILYERKICGLN